jgi:hypothetical protein
MRVFILLLTFVAIAFPVFGSSLSERVKELWQGEYELQDRWTKGEVVIKWTSGQEFSVLILMNLRDVEDCGDRSGCSFEGTFVPSGLKATAVRSGLSERDRVFLEIDGAGRLAFLPSSLEVAAGSCPSICAAPGFTGVFRKKAGPDAAKDAAKLDPSDQAILISEDGSLMTMIQGGPIRQRIVDAKGRTDYFWSNRSVHDFWVDQSKVRCWQYALYCVISGETCSPCSNALEPAEVTFQEAQAYARYYGKRLPTQYEWLKISTGGIDSLHFAGNTPLGLHVPGVPGQAVDGSGARVRFDVLNGTEWAVSRDVGCFVGASSWRDLLMFDDVNPMPETVESKTGFRCVTDPLFILR